MNRIGHEFDDDVPDHRSGLSGLQHHCHADPRLNCAPICNRRGGSCGRDRARPARRVRNVANLLLAQGASVTRVRRAPASAGPTTPCNCRGGLVLKLELRGRPGAARERGYQYRRRGVRPAHRRALSRPARAVGHHGRISGRGGRLRHGASTSAVRRQGGRGAEGGWAGRRIRSRAEGPRCDGAGGVRAGNRAAGRRSAPAQKPRPAVVDRSRLRSARCAHHAARVPIRPASDRGGAQADLRHRAGARAGTHGADARAR